MTRKYNPENILFYRPNEIKPSYVGTAGLNPKPYSVSAPRLHMLNSHMSQKPAILYGQPARLFTGFEREHGKNLHIISMPCDAIIREVISKYANHIPYGQHSPLTIVVFENVETGEIDEIEVPHNHCTHQTFGFRYIRTDVMNDIYPEQRIAAGTLLAHPATLNSDGDWCYGRNLRMGLFQSEEGIEDGLAISESAAAKFAMYGYGTVETVFGKNRFLVNAHGSNTVFKPWLNLGDKIPPSGVVVAARDYDPDLAPANMSRASLRRVNVLDDAKFGIPGATIVNINVIKSANSANDLPQELKELVDRHWDRNIQFQNTILNTNKNFKKMYHSSKYAMTDKWNTRVRTALFEVNAKGGAKKETFRKSTLSESIVELQYEYIYIPLKGSKFTDRQAGKAVAVRIVPDNEMPYDSKGKRLDAYMDDLATASRMNTPRLDEVLVTACAETCTDMIRDIYLKDHEHGLDRAWALLRRFYQIISPPLMEDMDTVTDREKMREDIEWIIQDPEDVPEHFIAGIRIAAPSDMPINWIDAMEQLNKEFPALNDYVYFTNKAGVVEKSKAKMVIGEMYIIPLERAGNRFSATSSAKRQHHGIPVKPSKSERNSSPINDSSTRDNGEDETRGKVALTGSRNSAEVFDRTLNPKAHQQECRSVFASDNPARILNTVPRTIDEIDPTVKDQQVIPLTGGRVVDIRDHVVYCGGVAFAEGEDGDAI